MKKIIPAAIIVFSLLAIFSCVSYDLAQRRQNELFYQSIEKSDRYEIPLCQLNKNRQIVERSGYVLCYNEKHEQADWVAYTLDISKLEKNTKRTNDFREDFEIKSGSAILEDYRKSGYDRGHLAPAGDMAYSVQAMSESFLLSNISPQPHPFNEGVWNSLEQHFRNLAQNHEKIYIATGPLLEKNIYPTIGKNKVSVPEYFYKVALIKDAENYKMEAYIIPASAAKENFRNYRFSVDQVEERTGLDFFYLMDDELENRLEAEK
ncbi:MAG: DNA/RNA non-specific endonuclease [Treponema sp.]|nr:DNA/RNA non-specific endonuclease [Treponema sp.]